MNEYRFYCNRQPDVAKNRADLAAIYRKLRRDGRTDIGRLLWKRTKAAAGILKQALHDSIYTRGTGASDGLGRLFE